MDCSLHPWDFPGKNTGVGCLTPMGFLPGSFTHGFPGKNTGVGYLTLLQGIFLDQTRISYISCIGRQFLYH